MPLLDNLFSVLYGVAGLVTFVRVVQARQSFFDRIVTNEDISLAWGVSLFLLTPVGVLAHELGHYLTADYLGASDVQLHHRGYWGFVSYSATSGVSETKLLIVIGAGPFVGVLLGYLSLAVGALISRRVIFRYLLVSFGLFTVMHNLVFYPLIDALSHRYDHRGDFYNLYFTSQPESMMAIVGLIHAILLGFLVLVWRRSPIQDVMNYISLGGLSTVIVNGDRRNRGESNRRRIRFPSIAGFGLGLQLLVGIVFGFTAAVFLFPMLPDSLKESIEEFFQLATKWEISR